VLALTVVAASASRLRWAIDPYRIALITTTILATTVTLTRVGRNPHKQ
jgi:hypothetical protein